MKGSILGSRALRVACACALALGIAPAAAWGVADGEQPASDVDALQEVVEDISQEGDGEMPEKGEPTPDDDADSEAADEQAPGEGANNGGDENGAPEAEKGEGSSIPEGEPGAEPEAQPGDATPTAQPLSKAGTSADDVSLTLSTTSIQGNFYRCAFDADSIHRGDGFEVRYMLDVPEGRSQDDYRIDFLDVGGVSVFRYNDETGNGGTLYFQTDEPGTIERSLYVHDWSLGEPESSENYLAEIPVTIKGILIDETFKMEAKPDFSLELRDSAFIFDSLNEDPDCVFSINEAAQACFVEHEWNEILKSITTDDPSILEIDLDNRVVSGIGTGTATLTVEIANGERFTSTITVDGQNDADDIDWSQVVPDDLKFTQQTLNLTAGQSFLTSLFFENFINGKDSVNWSLYLTTSNQSVLSYPLPEDESPVGDGGGNVLISACRPGTAKLYLYFYNPETEESILTDTMTVNVKAASPTASSTPGSAYAGDIVSSGAADDIVKLEGLSLATSVKSPDSLTADQRQGLLEVTNTAEGEKAVLVDISLVRSDGTVFDGYDELDSNYVFTVRLKLEGDLAGLDADTIRTYRIHKDGGMEPITCWVHDGYLYISTRHFSPYAIVGQAKSATGGNTGGVGNGSQGGNAGTNDTQGGSTTTVTDKGNASGTSTAKNDAAKASDATRSGAPLAQTGDSLLPLAATLGVAAILGAAGLAVARRRMNRW